jgi:hypothetical protein
LLTLLIPQYVCFVEMDYGAKYCGEFVVNVERMWRMANL